MNDNIPQIKPFQAFVYNSIPTLFDNSLSYYELLSKFLGYLNILIDSANSQGQQIEALTNMYNELANFLNEYLDSDEFKADLNEKLDAMATDGTLAEIINQQLFADMNASISQNTLDISALETSLLNTEETLSESITSLQTTTNAMLDNLSHYKSIKQYPRLEGETNDNGRFTRALNGGGLLVLENESYDAFGVEIPSNSIIIGNGATIEAVNESDSIFIVRGTSKDIIIEGIKFIGRADGTTDTAAGVKLTLDNINGGYNSNARNVAIENCYFEHFVFGVYGIATTNLIVRNCKFYDMKYVSSVSAGGYGILTESCHKVLIEHNEFIATTTDRHAIYISNSNSISLLANKANVDVTIQNNKINWMDVGIKNGHEYAATIRTTKNLQFINNRVMGGYGGVMLNASAGDIDSAVIMGNVITGIKTTTGERAVLGTTLSDTGTQYNINNLTIIGNTLIGTMASVHCVQLAIVKGATVIGNVIKPSGALAHGIYAYNSEDITVDGNTIKHSNSSELSWFNAGTVTNVLWGSNLIDGILRTTGGTLTNGKKVEFVNM